MTHDSHDGDAQARSTAGAVARRDYGKLVAFLAAPTQDVAAAEDALSEAVVAALEDWPRNGCPSNPEAWLLTVARRKVIDVARRRGKRRGCDQLQLLAEGWTRRRTRKSRTAVSHLCRLRASGHRGSFQSVR